MLGFSIYSYEGIGVIMPIMAVSDNPHRFKEMLTYTIVCLTIFYILFADFAYFAWGSNLNKPLITEMLP